MAKSFRCKLVTPTAALVDDMVRYASVPAHDGLLGVEAGHAPTLVRLGQGELRLDLADDAKLGKGGSRSYALNGGTMKVANDELIILAEAAVAAETINVADIEKQVRELASAPTSPVNSNRLNFARTQLAVARKGASI